MTFTRKWFIATAVVAALAALGVGTALATSESPAITKHAEVESNEADESADDTAEDEAEGPDTPISDHAALDKASKIALDWLQTEHGATGTVSATEVGDEESYYEIEVTLDDGRQVDVQLTKNFEVVGLD
jgi:uncharacterized membrane protein YkoI